MRLLLTLHTGQKQRNLPVNYGYPLSAALYKIISKGNATYSAFLHEQGYGKGFRFFTFSQLQMPFRINGDRLMMTGNELHFQVAFQLPQALETFVKGLFLSESIDIADKQSGVSFKVKTIESLPDPLRRYQNNEIVNIVAHPISPLVAGLKNEKGYYEFLRPDKKEFAGNIIYNWHEKIKALFDEQTSGDAILLVEVIPFKNPFKSRLMTIKSDTASQTKIRGWINFGLKITAEKRFLDLLLNAGAGLYNSMGCGMLEVRG